MFRATWCLIEIAVDLLCSDSVDKSKPYMPSCLKLHTSCLLLFSHKTTWLPHRCLLWTCQGSDPLLSQEQAYIQTFCRNEEMSCYQGDQLVLVCPGLSLVWALQASSPGKPFHLRQIRIMCHPSCHQLGYSLLFLEKNKPGWLYPR